MKNEKKQKMKKELLDNEEYHLDVLFEDEDYDEILKIRWYLNELDEKRDKDYYDEGELYKHYGVSYTEEYLCMVDDELIFFERKRNIGAYNLVQDKWGELETESFSQGVSYHLLGRNEEIHHVLLDYIDSGNLLVNNPLILIYLEKIL